MNEPQRIRIIVIDDHAKVHRALATLVDLVDDLVIVAQGSNGEEALDLCARYDPDVVLMDVIMPGMDGIQATEALLEQNPGLKILALSSFQDEDSVRAMLDAGAVGYILKDSSIDDLAHTIRAVHTGQAVFSPEVTQLLLRPREAATDTDYGLTPRELEVLALMVQGLNNREIAEALVVSQSTAKYHVSSILAKLSVSSRVEAVALAVERNLVT